MEIEDCKERARCIINIYSEDILRYMKYDVGGQAVIEGVMMKSPKRYSIAVRMPDGSIKTTKGTTSSVVKRYKILNLPILRGIIYLFEMLSLGIKSLSWSAEMQSGEEEISSTEMAFTIIVSLAISIGIFVVLPLFITKAMTSDHGLLFNAIDGLIRIIFFLVYLFAIGRFAEIKRVFQYHGAEHKTVNCFEKGMKLTIQNVKRCSMAHPRCGTSFLVFVVILSILLFSLITSPEWYIKLMARIALIPIIAGISFEALKWSAKHTDKRWVKMAIAPGLWVQSLTTNEPDEKQIEVAIEAMKIATR